MKIALDSNVLIAAFATDGLCRSILELCLNHHEIILSEELLEEVNENLQKKIRIPPARVREVIHYLKNNATIGKGQQGFQTTGCRDADDVKVLNLIVTAKVDMLVTGDKDLLSLREFQSIPIVSPRDSLSRLQR